MKAQSKDYIRLQNIYKAKARSDLSEVVDTVRTLEQTLCRATPPIEEKEIEAFCKNAASVKLIRGRKLPVANAGATRSGDDRTKALAASVQQQQQQQDESSLAHVHVAFLAWDRFWNDHGRAPGHAPPHADDAADLRLLAAYVASVVRPSSRHPSPPSSAPYAPVPKKQKCDDVDVGDAEVQIPPLVDRTLRELLRAGGAELHNVSALTGGMVAQEVIKVVTGQYVPVDDYCVFDGVGSRSAVLKI